MQNLQLSSLAVVNSEKYKSALIHEIIPILCEILESLVKACHGHFVSKHGICPHLVSYIESKKSTVSKIFNKVGGKGSKPLLEDVIKNTELTVSVSPPQNISCFYSFDNIQTLFRSHRLDGKNADKVIAIVVTLCLQFYSISI